MAPTAIQMNAPCPGASPAARHIERRSETATAWAVRIRCDEQQVDVPYSPKHGRSAKNP